MATYGCHPEALLEYAEATNYSEMEQIIARDGAAIVGVTEDNIHLKPHMDSSALVRPFNTA